MLGRKCDWLSAAGYRSPVLPCSLPSCVAVATAVFGVVLLGAPRLTTAPRCSFRGCLLPSASRRPSSCLNEACALSVTHQLGGRWMIDQR